MAAAEAAGVSVQPLHCPNAKGVPDLLLGIDGFNVLVEVKRPLGPRGGRSHNHQNLKPDQVAWHKSWQGQVCVVRSVDEMIDLIRGVRGWLREQGWPCLPAVAFGEVGG